MKSLRLLDRRLGVSLSAVMLLLGMGTPALVPAFASAANQVTARSIQMSSDAVGVTASYKLTFTPVTTTAGANGGFYLDFCSDTPVITNSCTAPTGFTAASATASTGTLTAATNSLKLVIANTGGTPITVTFSNITNPTVTGSLYARIMVYDGTTYSLANHTSTTVQGAYSDGGGIAMYITNTIGVQATVRETLQFCVSGATMTASCVGLSPASLTLGHGSPSALDATVADVATAYSQLSSNASGGVTVRMTNNNSCGGLSRAGSGGTCEIPAVSTGGNASGGYQIPTAGAGGFGLNVNSIAGTSPSFGTVTAAAPYNGSTFSSTGYFGMDTTTAGNNVTTTYGSTIFSSTGPAANMNENLTFAAAAATNSPAGNYSATMNLVATGTF